MNCNRKTIGSWRRRVAPCLCLLGLLVLLLPSTAAATYDPVGAGATTIHLSRSFVRHLHSEGVKLGVAKGAELRGNSVSFPTSAGRIDPLNGLGRVKHEGALLLIQGRHRVPLRGLILKTAARRSPLSAKVGGGQLKLASAKRLAIDRSGFGMKVRATGLRLTAAAALRLSRKLHSIGALAAGEALGTALTRVEPQLAAVAATGVAYLTLDPGLLAKLNQLHVSLNPIHPAEHLGTAFNLPIAKGQIAPDGSSGEVDTGGAIEGLQLGSGQIFWQELGIDLTTGTLIAEVDVEPAPPYPGKVGRIAIAGLVPTSVSSDPANRTVSVSAALFLSETAAAQLNQAYGEGKPVFVPGEPLGTISALVTAE